MKIDSQHIAASYNQVNQSQQSQGVAAKPENSAVKSDENKNQAQKVSAEQQQKDALKAIEKIAEHTKLQEVGLELKIDKDATRGVIVKLIDKERDEVIRQIPSEEAVELAKHLKKVFDGINEKRQGVAGGFINDKI